MTTINAECRIGIIATEDTQTDTPYMWVDLGREYPSFYERFSQYRGLQLDVIASDDGTYHYNVTTDELRRDGSPDFGFYFSADSDDHLVFIAAKEENCGMWYLILITSDAIECLVDGNGTIVSMTLHPRSVFALDP